MSEEQKQPEACIVIYDNSQCIVATRFRCDGTLTMTLLQICCRYRAYLHDLPCRLATSSYRGRVDQSLFPHHMHGTGCRLPTDLKMLWSTDCFWRRLKTFVFIRPCIFSSCRLFLFTGSIALIYSEADFEVFRPPNGRHVAPIGVKFGTMRDRRSPPQCQI